MRNQRGFTIVELLIVIIILAILVAILIVVFTGINDRAYDNRRIAEAKSVAQAFSLYGTQNGTTILTGTGIGGTGRGLLNNIYNGTTQSILQKFNLSGVATIDSDLTDPQYPDSINAYYIYQCLNGSSQETGEFAIIFYTSKNIEPYYSNMTRYRNGTCGSAAQNDMSHLGFMNAAIIGKHSI